MLSKLAKRCVEVSYRHKLSHVSSVLNTVDLLASIYKTKQPEDVVILDNGHASLAHYVVLESLGLGNAVNLFCLHGVHSRRDVEHGIHVSNGSLGQAATVAFGMALADPSRKVYLVTSDGACMEGCVYEVIRNAKRTPNLLIYVVFNGYGAYGTIDNDDILWGANVRRVGHDYPEFLKGLNGHYLVLTEAQRDELMA